jgi:hypothetical protein
MFAKLALAAAVTTLVGCSAGPAARPVVSAPAPAPVTQRGVSSGLASVASAYTLVAVDGHALPYAPADTKGETHSAQVVSGTLDLQPDGTFTMSTQYRAVERQGDRVYDGKASGTCAPEGDDYRLYWNGGGETALTVSGDAVIVNNDGTLFRYLRRR